MKSVGVREFRDHATKYLAGDEALAIERHGEPIGYYIPSKRRRREEIQTAVDRLGRVVEQFLAKTGLTEDQLAEAMDITKPMPAWMTTGDDAGSDDHATGC